MNKPEIQTMEDVADVAVRQGLTRGQKVGIIVAGALVTAGIGYGIYRLVGFLKARKAAKAHPEVEEVHE